MSRISQEKSKFAQTCNLLSHYVKEKGRFLDLSIGINGEVSAQNDVKPMNLFPQDAVRVSSSRFVVFVTSLVQDFSSRTC